LETENGQWSSRTGTGELNGNLPRTQK
jgi:hypothetical protein